MVTTSAHSKTFKVTPRLALGITLILLGAYLTFTALSPLIFTASLNPTSNPVTEKLAKTTPQIPEDRLYIPKIAVDVPFKSGDAAVMENGAWWRHPARGNPADGGNFILSAHRFLMGFTPEQTYRQSPFYRLHDLAVGDQIIVDYRGHRYTYLIESIFAVAPDDTKIERPTDDARLTLYSCTLGGARDGRDVIIARPQQ